MSKEMDTRDLGGAFLAHHGVKGQKWGVRRAEKLEARATKKAAKAADQQSIHDSRAKFRSQASALKAKKKGGQLTRSMYKTKMKDISRSSSGRNAARYTKGEKLAFYLVSENGVILYRYLNPNIPQRYGARVGQYARK
jgi:hypothetical protein